MGSWQAPTAVKHDNRSRSYAANAFLPPCAGRANLVVLEDTVVTKLNLVTSSGAVSATSVQYVPNGGGEASSVPLADGGRVVVTAGKIHDAPQPLMRAGCYAHIWRSRDVPVT